MTEQINARGWIFQVKAADNLTWVDILGKRTFKLNPGENQEVTDMTTFEDAGQHRDQPMQRGSTLELEGRFLLSATNVRDTGQLRVETLGALVGNEAVGTLRFRYTTQIVWTVWACWVALGEVGGENNDKTSWAGTFTRHGVATTMAVA